MKYEKSLKKYRSLLEDARASIAANLTKTEKYKIAIGTTQEVLKTVTDKTVAKALNAQLGEWAKDISGLAEYTVQLRENITRYNTAIHVIQDDVCEHKNSVYYHTDYHKNEDFHRCTICEKVF